MAFTIQRVPRGLADVLTIFGGETPRDLAPEVRGSLELLQLYGSTQLQVASAANAALAQNGNIDIVVPATQHWVVFQMAALVANTATMTGLELALALGPSAALSVAVQTMEKTAGFAAGASIRIAWAAPYPRVLFPGAVLRFQLSRLGTDATANCLLSAQVGVLG